MVERQAPQHLSKDFFWQQNIEHVVPEVVQPPWNPTNVPLFIRSSATDREQMMTGDACSVHVNPDHLLYDVLNSYVP